MLHKPDAWQPLAESLLQYDEEMQAFIESEREATTAGAIQKFEEMTGLGRRSYFRTKREYYRNVFVTTDNKQQVPEKALMED
jgi:hypothetical protein